MPRLAADWIAKSLIRGTSFERQHRNLVSLGLGASMSDDLEKLINKALLRWKAREISLHFHGRKKFGVVWVARAYLDHSAVPARLAQSGVEGVVTMEKLAEFADRPIAQGQGKTAVEAVKAMTEESCSKL